VKILILDFETERLSMIERALEHHYKKLKKLESEPNIVNDNDLIKKDLQKNIEVIKQVIQLFSNPNTRYVIQKDYSALFCSALESYGDDLTSTKLALTEKLVKPELEFKNVDNELGQLKDTLEKLCRSN
jgi:hypothetical protein